ncbi:MAG: ribonuclease J [Candidatus Harrisonbacteria bacterium CG10_big_fil_rev_8_21_14_0_10_40_38]|uniref:Ribonuclease J n=1 Tax=Candidatus Harrisonbacteria bacterium CG10_big_fil_rev_8_21_14_0_10_40_38 TaxID=1974583 RepID=A0A2H0URI7_9BACT|nr:MAG: ribonuclease J [Candidatus Harrisonbacteria bacterium CG10_big_fil_rev_8_21_14_0_10_40_38]
MQETERKRRPVVRKRISTRKPPIESEKKVTEKKSDDAVKFIALGGLEEIGRNCYFFEYKDEIVLVDVGIQFPEEETPGIDYIIPNISYLESKKQNIKGIFLTHGHYDHIAAIHYLIEKLGNPTIYTADFTKAVVQRRHAEFINAPKLKFEVVKHGSRVKVGKYFSADFFTVDHTIPDALGFILETPVGNMVSFGDFRLKVNKEGKPVDLEAFEIAGKKGIHTVFMDSTNAMRPGFSSSEENVGDNLYELMAQAKGRIIVATFASLLTRLFEIIKIGEKLGRKIALNGRSMKDNFLIAQQLGYVKYAKDLVIPLEEIHKHKDEKIIILTTGSQGEPNAGLMRIVNREHRLVSLKRSDTVIFSSSVVPGNERSVQSLQDNIARQVDEIYNSKLLDIHTSGHAHQEDLKLVMKMIKPKYVVPIHGYYLFRAQFKKLAAAANIPKENVILLDNGDALSLEKNDAKMLEEKAPANYVMVDGLGVGDVEEVVLRDRVVLANEGMIVVIATIEKSSGRLIKNPDIISRGFIYLKENREILDEIRRKLRLVIGKMPKQEANPDYVKGMIRNQIGQLIYQKTKRRPMILPVIIEI